LVEYDLTYEPLHAMKGQVVADFIVNHKVETDDECLITMSAWSLFFYGSVCAQGCRVGCVMMALSGVIHELSVHLEFGCTNNQAEYENLAIGLEHFIDMGVRHVEAFRDSRLVVQQIRGENQCLDGVLISYHEYCSQLIKRLDTFHIEHVPQSCNGGANELA
jgi:ribonuclease HI